MEFRRDYRAGTNKIISFSVFDDRETSKFELKISQIFIQDFENYQSGNYFPTDAIVTISISAPEFNGFMEFLGEYFQKVKKMLGEQEKLENEKSELPDAQSLIDEVKNWLGKIGEDE